MDRNLTTTNSTMVILRQWFSKTYKEPSQQRVCMGTLIWIGSVSSESHGWFGLMLTIFLFEPTTMHQVESSKFLLIHLTPHDWMVTVGRHMQDVFQVYTSAHAWDDLSIYLPTKIELANLLLFHISPHRINVCFLIHLIKRLSAIGSKVQLYSSLSTRVVSIMNFKNDSSPVIIFNPY